MSTLTDVRVALEKELGDDAKFSFINTRLILTTGVNLRQISAQENVDPVRIKRALNALAMMGFLQASEGATVVP